MRRHRSIMVTDLQPRRAHHLMTHRSLPLFILLLLPTLVAAQPVEEIRARYTKYEYRIPMRDGKKLFTAVYVPKNTTWKFPIMLMRTPYTVRPYGVDKYPDHLGPSQLFAREGYIFAYQDVRGRWLSEGEFVNM